MPRGLESLPVFDTEVEELVKGISGVMKTIVKAIQAIAQIVEALGTLNWGENTLYVIQDCRNLLLYQLLPVLDTWVKTTNFAMSRNDFRTKPSCVDNAAHKLALAHLCCIPSALEARKSQAVPQVAQAKDMKGWFLELQKHLVELQKECDSGQLAQRFRMAQSMLGGSRSKRGSKKLSHTLPPFRPEVEEIGRPEMSSNLMIVYVMTTLVTGDFAAKLRKVAEIVVQLENLKWSGRQQGVIDMGRDVLQNKLLPTLNAFTYTYNYATMERDFVLSEEQRDKWSSRMAQARAIATAATSSFPSTPGTILASID
ncbi:hypothetical protein MNV49_003601 [Pseudohyphozyma bogoriensis]|nr:hypothetical protein MNV49_003601 [Pseudohyphozyma bogoriensis]